VTAAMTVEAPRIAYTYLRISSDRDGDELGVERQRASLRDLIERQGWVHGREFCDNDQSAFRGKRREGYEGLLSAVRAGECDVLVTTEMSRFTRHPRELEDLVDLIEATGVQVAAQRAGHIDLSTSGGRVMARILGAMARMESEQMGERIRSKMAANAKAGKPSGGPRPFGYDRVNGKLVLNKAEAKLIRGWADAILVDGATVSSIVTDLNAKAVPTVRGGIWTGPTINQILLSPRVIGMTGSGGEPVAEGDWPKILDRKEWEQIRGVLQSRRRGPQPRASLLANMIVCGDCGTKMAGASRGAKPRQYVCPKGRRGCGKLSIMAGPVDDYVVGLVLGAASTANLSMVRAERHVKDSQRFVAEVAEDEQLLSDLAADLGARRLTRGEWISARAEIEARLTRNRAALQAVGAGDRLPADLVRVDAEKWETLAFEEKRAIIGLFIDRVTVMRSGRTGRTFSPQRLRVSWKA